MMNAIVFLKEGKYTNNGGKKDRNGNYQDEIVPIGDWTVWFYHANPIVAFHRVSGAVLRTTSGWRTKTTKDRLNSIPGSFISQKKGEWYEKGEPFEDLGEDIRILLGRESYHRIDGWRGYSIPPFAVAGSSDTGSWSDSPCPSSAVEEEIKKVQGILAEHNIKSYVVIRETSNVFCVKRWVCVRGIDFRDASLAMRARGAAFSYVEVLNDVNFD